MDSLQLFTSSIQPGGSSVPTFNWNFGDGQTASSTTGNVITHGYSASSSNIIVKHWVSYSGGCSSDTASETIPVIYLNPVASFNIIGDTLCVKKPITLTSSLTGIANWQWTLGTTSSTSVPPFTHSFNNAGNQDITLVVKSLEGCGSAPVSQSININPIPVVNAGPDKYIKLGSSTTLDATISGPAGYDFLWTPSVFLNDPTLLNPVSTPDVTTTYTIRATDILSGCYAEDAAIVTPVSEIYIPNAFTPNNDGKNDKWEIPGLALYPDAKVSVYDRWGQKIFEAKNYVGNPWNGFYKGVIQAGVYVYMVQLNDDKKRSFKGTVMVIQ